MGLGENPERTISETSQEVLDALIELGPVGIEDPTWRENVLNLLRKFSIGGLTEGQWKTLALHVKNGDSNRLEVFIETLGGINWFSRSDPLSPYPHLSAVDTT